MLEITESWVDSLAPNSAAIKNGHELVKKGKFTAFHQTEDRQVLFGICTGSGKTPYIPSADFMTPGNPVMRCTCPSRQFPCKHGLGLLYAYVEGKSFTQAGVPEELAAKREKAGKREEKKAKELAGEAESKPKKVNKSALKKKIAAQLEGLDVLERLTHTLVRRGFGSLDSKELKMIQEHVKQMGSHYLNGAQIQLRKLQLILSSEDKEKAYAHAAEQLAVIHAFIKKGRAHLLQKLEDPELTMDHESTIEEWLGHAWQIAELRAANLTTHEVEMIQLSFISYDDPSRQEYFDLGYWIQLDSGAIHSTVQYRPYKAAKLMREEDSFFDVARIPQLYRYPGDMNRRVRYESFTTRKIEDTDLSGVRKFAVNSYAEAVKKVKNQLKNPLADPNPVMLLRFEEVTADEAGRLFISNSRGESLELFDLLEISTVPLLKLIPQDQLQDTVMLVLFDHHTLSGRLRVQPLSLLNGKEIIRFIY